MSDPQTRSISSAGGVGKTLRLLCPQWQGAGTTSVRALASEFPFDVARRGYAVGSAVLEAILPPNDGVTAIVPIAMGDERLELVDGVEARSSSSSSGARWR
jgi:arginase